MNGEERHSASGQDGGTVSTASPPSVADLFTEASRQHRAGRLIEAEALYRQILAIDPKHARSLHRLGLMASQAGRNDIAVDMIGQAIALDAQNPSFHNDLGIALQNLSRLAEAAKCYGRALELKPDYAEAHYNLGTVLHNQSKLIEAAESYRRALVLKPNFAEGYNYLGIALQNLGRLAEAVESYRRALVLKPDFAEAHSNLGSALQARGELDEAVESYQRALALKPGYAVAHSNLGNAFQAQSRFAEAVESYRRALALKPDYADAHNNLGTALNAQGRYPEAVESRRRALELIPDNPEFHSNLGWALLRIGEFEAGWVECEWRFKKKGPNPFSQPLWDGSVLGSRKLLLHAEGGYGDTLQFCRFAPLLGRQAHIVLAVQRPLVRLLSGLPDVAEIIAVGDELPPFDVQCPLLSLPRFLGTRLETIPDEVPYLRAEPERAAFWRRRLDALDGLCVGLVWAGSSAIPAVDRHRSISLDALASLGSIKGVSFVSLQKYEDGREKPVPGEELKLHDWTDELDDYAETAALIDGLDLVIAVDTSVAHLAGALGKKVWLLNRFDTCWRWLLDRDDSPWYPTLRQFRQKSFGDWTSVIREVRKALQNQVHASPSELFLHRTGPLA